MMRAKLILLGAVAAVALSSTAAVASVVVVRSLGPSAKAYPPGKTLPESASISLKGGDVVTLLGPSSAKTLRGPGNFDAKQRRQGSAVGSAHCAPPRSPATRASGISTLLRVARFA
jgi:hypothetical protein